MTPTPTYEFPLTIVLSIVHNKDTPRIDHTHPHTLNFSNLSPFNLVSICRCPRPLRNPVYASRLDPSVLPLSLSLHRHPYIYIYIYMYSFWTLRITPKTPIPPTQKKEPLSPTRTRHCGSPHPQRTPEQTREKTPIIESCRNRRGRRPHAKLRLIMLIKSSFHRVTKPTTTRRTCRTPSTGWSEHITTTPGYTSCGHTHRTDVDTGRTEDNRSLTGTTVRGQPSDTCDVGLRQPVCDYTKMTISMWLHKNDHPEYLFPIPHLGGLHVYRIGG